jgi:hypothetical protein
VPEDEIISVSQDRSVEPLYAKYPDYRKVYYYIIHEIQQQFAEQFTDDESVRKEFVKAHFTGKILPIARYVEETFWGKVFRMLGMMNNDERAARILNSLKEYRTYIKSKNA